MTASSLESLLQSPSDEFHLACVLLSPSGQVHLTDTLAKVDPDDFDDPTFGWLWSAARRIHATGERITKRGLLAVRDADLTPMMPFIAPSAASIRGRLEQISGQPVFAQRIQSSIRVVTQTAKIRRLVQSLDRAKASAVTAEDYSHALSATFHMLNQLEEGDLSMDLMPFSDLVDEFHKTQADGFVAGMVIPTPWPAINEILSGGFRPGHSYVIGGRPNEGKSIVGLNCAQTAAEQGFRTLVISAEMSGLEVTERMMAAGAHVEYGEITRRAMNPDTYTGVMKYSDIHRDMPLWVIDRPNLTIEHIAAVARTMKRRQGLDLLAIDYVQLLSATEKRDVREQQVAHISRSTKNLARELHCSAIILAQLNREPGKMGRRPLINDLRESDSLGQDADGVILLHHEPDNEGRPSGMVTFIIGKNRFGRRDDIVLPWRAHQARIGG